MRVRRVCKRLSVFSRSSMVSSCVRWLYCCNPPNPIVVSVPRVHTHTHTHTYTQSLAVCCCHLKHSGNPPAHPTWNTHNAVIQAKTHTCACVTTPNTGRQFILSMYACFAGCKLDLSRRSGYFSSFVSTSHIHSSEGWTASSVQTSGQPGVEGLAGQEADAEGGWLEDRKRNEGTRCVSQIR